MEFSPEWFDSSSRAWLANKKRMSEGSYTYVCGVETCKTRVKGDDINCRTHKGRGIDLNQPPVSISKRSARGATLLVDFNQPAPGPKEVKESVQPTRQGSGSQADLAQHPHTAESPTELQDLGVAGRVVHRRRVSPSQ